MSHEFNEIVDGVSAMVRARDMRNVWMTGAARHWPGKGASAAINLGTAVASIRIPPSDQR